MMILAKEVNMLSGMICSTLAQDEKIPQTVHQHESNMYLMFFFKTEETRLVFKSRWCVMLKMKNCVYGSEKQILWLNVRQHVADETRR